MLASTMVCTGIGLACETAVGSLIRIVPTVGIVDVLQSGFGFLDFPEQTRLVVPHTGPGLFGIVIAVIDTAILIDASHIKNKRLGIQGIATTGDQHGAQQHQSNTVAGGGAIL